MVDNWPIQQPMRRITFLNIHFIVLKFLFYTSVELKHMKKHAMCDVGRGIRNVTQLEKCSSFLSSQYWRSKFNRVQYPRTWSVTQKFKPLKMSMAYTLYTIQMNKHISHLTLSAWLDYLLTYTVYNSNEQTHQSFNTFCFIRLFIDNIRSLTILKYEAINTTQFPRDLEFSKWINTKIICTKPMYNLAWWEKPNQKRH